jgi:hypothetical protein
MNSPSSPHLLVSPPFINEQCENRHIINSNTSIAPDYNSFYQTKYGYVSLDPRTYDTTRNMYMTLNQPPLQSSNTLPQHNMNTIRTNKTGFYNDYESINGGNIKYYTSLNTSSPIDEPIFNIPSYIKPQVLIDPMGSVKPYYQRIPVFETNVLKSNSLYDYSFTRDTSEFREDLTSYRNGIINRVDFNYYQLFNEPSKYYPTFKPFLHYPLQ